MDVLMLLILWMTQIPPATLIPWKGEESHAQQETDEDLLWEQLEPGYLYLSVKLSRVLQNVSTVQNNNSGLCWMFTQVVSVPGILGARAEGLAKYLRCRQKVVRFPA